MKIESIELTKDEMNQAVKLFLGWKNINLEVLNVEAKGYPTKHWIIDVNDNQTELAKIGSNPAKPITEVKPV